MVNLFGINTGANIYLSVSQACGLEMIEIDKNGYIKSYAQSPLEYNESAREIANYDDFKAAVEDVFAIRNINPKDSNIHLSVPTVWFGAKEGLPLLLDDSSIETAVLGDLEQKYIFKGKSRSPIPFWFDNQVSQNSDSRNIFFTAIQADALDIIKEIFSSMGANLVSIECSLFASLKGLYVADKARAQMDSDTAWSLMIVNNIGFQLVDMQGKKIVSYFEEPLPLKTYEGDEIYNAIENAAQIAFMSTTASSLVIVSETDLVSAQVLAERLQFGGEVTYVEDNKLRTEPLMDLNLNILSDDQIKVSLHAIGHCTQAKDIGMPVDVNFIANSAETAVAYIDTPFGQITPQKALIAVAILGALILIPLLLINLLTQNLLSKAQNENNLLDEKITQLDENLNKYQGTASNKEFNPINEIEQVLKYNRTKIMAYAALGESIPKNIYLTYFITGDDGKINIKGCAATVEDVYVFYKNLKDSLLESKLRISKLDLKTGSLDSVVNSTVSTVDDAPYVFEITNLSEDELKAFKGGSFSVDTGNSEQQPEQQPEQQQQQPPQQEEDNELQ